MLSFHLLGSSRLHCEVTENICGSALALPIYIATYVVYETPYKTMDYECSGTQ